MKDAITVFLLCACTTVLPTGRSAAQTPLPPGVVAVVDGIRIPTAVIADRLWRESGSVALDRAITAEIVRQEARKLGISVSAEEIQTRMSEYRAAFMTAPGNTPAAWEEFLKKYSLADIERRQTDDLLAKKLGEYFAEKTELTSEEKSRVRTDLERAAHTAHGRIILIGIGKEFDNRTESAARQKAEETLAKIAGGASWDSVCSSTSDDVSTRQTSGDLGFVTREQLDKALENVLFTAEPGAASRQVVRVMSGYAVVELLERKDVAPTEEAIQTEMSSVLKRKKELAKEVTTWFPLVQSQYKVERQVPYRRSDYKPVN